MDPIENSDPLPNPIETPNQPNSEGLPQPLMLTTAPSSLAKLLFNPQSIAKDHEAIEGSDCRVAYSLWNNGSIEYIYHFNRKIPVAREDVIAEFLIRPDVYEASVVTLVETIMMTLNGSTSKKTASSAAAIELSDVTITAGSSNRYFVRVYINVNPKLQRALLIHLGPEVPTTTGAKLTSVFGSDISAFPAFASNVLSQIELALYSEMFSLQYLIDIGIHSMREADRLIAISEKKATIEQTAPAVVAPIPKKEKTKRKKKKLNPFDDSDSESDTEQHSIGSSAVTCEETKAPEPEVKFNFPVSSLMNDIGFATESVLDPGYVRDLQLGLASIMNRRLLGEVDTTEKQVKTLEFQCARLMTVLKPNYQLCCLTMPSVPVIKPLTDYPLNLSKKPIGELCEETTRLIVFRARRSAKDEVAKVLKLTIEFQEENTWIGKLLHHQFMLYSVLLSALRQLHDWEFEERTERLRRKMLQLNERITSIEEFKLVLISTLHYRNLSETTTADRNAIASLQEKCRAITEHEPLLLEVQATLNGRSGVLFVTLNHIFFYSHGGIFLSIYVELFQIARLVKITSADPVSTLGVGSVVLEDEGKGITSMEVSGITSDYHTRIADFLNQLKQIQELQKSGQISKLVYVQKPAATAAELPSTSSPAPSNTNPVPSPTSNKQRESFDRQPKKVEEILQSVAVKTIDVPGFSIGNLLLLDEEDELLLAPCMPVNTALSGKEATRDALKDPLDDPFAELASMTAGDSLPIPVAPVSSNSVPTAASASTGAAKKSGLGRNIQAFLAQSQAKK